MLLRQYLTEQSRRFVLSLKLLHSLHRISVRLLIITFDWSPDLILSLIPAYAYLLICDLRLDDLADDFEKLETPDDVEDDAGDLEIPDDFESLVRPDDLASFEIPDDLASCEIPADVENMEIPAQNFLLQYSLFFLSAILEHNRHKMSANIGPIELSWVISSGFIISVIAPIEFGVLFWPEIWKEQMMLVMCKISILYFKHLIEKLYRPQKNIKMWLMNSLSQHDPEHKEEEQQYHLDETTIIR